MEEAVGFFLAVLFDRFLESRQFGLTLQAASDTFYLVPYVRYPPIVCKRVKLNTKYSHLSLRQLSR